MTRLRLAAWNIAWFADLFDRSDRLRLDATESALPGVSRRRQAEAIATVLRAVDADLYAILEAPNTGRRQSTVRALEGFAGRFSLRQRAAVIGQPSPTHQEIALLFDPGRLAARPLPIGRDVAAAEVLALFSKPPLEATVRDRCGGLTFHLVALHLKASEAVAVRAGAAGQAARVRQQASVDKRRMQARWLRRRVISRLAEGAELVVLGDFNDGPGRGPDDPESSVQVVAGLADEDGPRLVCPWIGGDMEDGEARPVTARFADPAADREQAALIDFILLSPGLAARTGPCWRVWAPAPFGDGADAFAEALRAASDHFPVTVDLHAAGAEEAGRKRQPPRGSSPSSSTLR